MSKAKKINWSMVQNKEEAEKLIRQWKQDTGKNLSIKTIKDLLTTAAQEKVAEPVKSALLTLAYAEPRPVRIEYLDSGEVEKIVTIPQLALIGEVRTYSGTVTLFQVWVGRVFPQWRAGR